MKIYGKSRFFWFVGYLALAAGYLIKGVSCRSGFHIVMGVLWAVWALASLRLSMDAERAEEERELEARSRKAARRRFGRWAWLVRWLGALLAALGLALAWRGGSVLLFALLTFGGLGYTLALELWLKRKTDQDEAGGGTG